MANVSDLEAWGKVTSSEQILCQTMLKIPKVFNGHNLMSEQVTFIGFAG